MENRASGAGSGGEWGGVTGCGAQAVRKQVALRYTTSCGWPAHLGTVPGPLCVPCLTHVAHRLLHNHPFRAWLTRSPVG